MLAVQRSLMSRNVNGVSEDHDDQDELDAGRTAAAATRTRSAIRPPTTLPIAIPPKNPVEDRRHGLGRVAEDEDQLARPDDLVDEAGRPGQDEDREDRPARSHRGSFVVGLAQPPPRQEPGGQVSDRGRRRVGSEPSHATIGRTKNGRLPNE